MKPGWCSQYNDYVDPDDPEFESQQRHEMCLFFKHQDRLCGPPKQVKQQRRKIDHSPASSGKVKNECSYTSILPYTFTMWTGAIQFSPFYS
jgi:hypothetical protein